jgi:hypothetical protein
VVVRETATGPAVETAGVITVTDVSVGVPSSSAAALPNQTLVVSANPVPLMVTLVPPRVGPVLGLSPVIVGPTARTATGARLSLDAATAWPAPTSDPAKITATMVTVARIARGIRDPVPS